MSTTTNTLSMPDAATLYKWGIYALYAVAAFVCGVLLYYLIGVIWAGGSLFWKMAEESLGGFASFLGWLEDHTWLAWLAVGLVAFIPLAGYSYKAWGWISEKFKEYRKVGVQNQPRVVQEWTMKRTKYEVRLNNIEEKIFNAKHGSAERTRLEEKRGRVINNFGKQWSGAKLNGEQRKSIIKNVGTIKR